MFKTVCLLKRRQGMSFEDFVTYYETHHRKIGEKVLPTCVRYMRRYLRPVPNPVTGEAAELDYDVLTEMWFETREAFEAAMTALSAPEVAAEIAEDEEKLFDRSKNRFCTIEEHESKLAAAI
ncbi:EthD domain-containing protein [Emcibacter sp. SYSU 3D8]|uniref:EthD domain-containing protein n=1 Tax=Emcibacter sp. SYSU 3D8 TaxID=3133969 RepID=UPI0031FE66A9